jgi:hypothetical protein
MNLTQLETMKMELKRKIYSQNKVLKLMGLKSRSCGYQEHLKRIKDGKDMAKTRFRGFSVKKQGSRGLTTRIQGLKHNYVDKPEVYNVKRQNWDLGWKTRKDRGLNRRNRGLFKRVYIGGSAFL